MTEPTSKEQSKCFYHKFVSKKLATISKKELLDELLTPEFIAEIEKSISLIVKKQITKLYNKVPTKTVNAKERVYVDSNSNVVNKCIIRECTNEYEPGERKEVDYDDAENVEFEEL
jgi:hypothetical protein